jgi:hypothetical protein
MPDTKKVTITESSQPTQPSQPSKLPPLKDESSPSTNPLLNLTAAQITQALAALTPDKLAAIKLAAAQSGIANKGDEKFRRLANGDIRILVTISNDLAEGLMTVANEAGEPPFDYIHDIIMQGVNGWFLGGVEDETPAITPATKIPIGTSA